MNVFISGSTGSIGFVLLRMMLEKTNHNFFLLVRDSAETTGEQRIEKMLRTSYAEQPEVDVDAFMSRIKVYSGNLLQKNFGLTDKEFDNLADKLDIIYHSAASLSFTQTLEDARNINVGGTKNVLALAEKCHNKGKLKRLHHVSTAYVSGTHSATFFEDMLEKGQGFNNTYEQTKYESEIIVREYLAKGYPITIYRPSIVICDSKTGEITKSNIIFDFMKRITQGKLKQVVCDPEKSSLNLIQMDFVVECLFEISEQPDSIGKTYNLTNNENTNIKELIGWWAKCGNVVEPEIVTFAEKEKASAGTILRLTPFLPYMQGGHTFDNTNALAATKKSPTKATTFEEMKRCIQYSQKHGLFK